MSPTPAPRTVAPADDPWLGLASFTEDLSGSFFGRDEEIETLLEMVRTEFAVVLFGQSGLGKTSLLQAGLFPRLRSTHFLPVYLRLDHNPEWPSLTTQMASALETALTAAGIEVPPRLPGDSLWAWLHRHDVDFWGPRQELVVPVFVIDQFEEIFTLQAGGLQGDPKRAELLETLVCLGRNQPPPALLTRLEANPEEQAAFDLRKTPARLLVTLREDFLPDLEPLLSRLPSLRRARLRLEPLRGDRALLAVQQPAAHLVDDGVAEKIVRFVASHGLTGGEKPDEPLGHLTVEPALLSVICRELNTRRLETGQPRLTADLLSGAKDAILEDFYERSMRDVPPVLRHYVEDQLLTPSGYRDNKALEGALATPGIQRSDLDQLVERRLLRYDERGGLMRVEVTHDRLAGVIAASRKARHEAEAEARARQEALALQKKLRQTRLLAAAAIFLLVIFGIVGYLAYVNSKRADTEAASSRNLASFMLGEVSTSLDRMQSSRFDRVDLAQLRSSLRDQITAYYTSTSSSREDPDSLFLKCLYQSCAATTELEAGHYSEAEAAGKALVATAGRFQHLHPGDPRARRQLVTAFLDLSTLHDQLDQIPLAFHEAAAAWELIQAGMDTSDPQLLQTQWQTAGKLAILAARQQDLRAHDWIQHLHSTLKLASILHPTLASWKAEDAAEHATRARVALEFHQFPATVEEAQAALTVIQGIEKTSREAAREIATAVILSKIESCRLKAVALSTLGNHLDAGEAASAATTTAAQLLSGDEHRPEFLFLLVTAYLTSATVQAASNDPDAVKNGRTYCHLADSTLQRLLAAQSAQAASMEGKAAAAPREPLHPWLAARARLAELTQKLDGTTATASSLSPEDFEKSLTDHRRTYIAKVSNPDVASGYEDRVRRRAEAFTAEGRPEAALALLKTENAWVQSLGPSKNKTVSSGLSYLTNRMGEVHKAMGNRTEEAAAYRASLNLRFEAYEQLPPPERSFAEITSGIGRNLQFCLDSGNPAETLPFLERLLVLGQRVPSGARASAPFRGVFTAWWPKIFPRIAPGTENAATARRLLNETITLLFPEPATTPDDLLDFKTLDQLRTEQPRP